MNQTWVERMTAAPGGRRRFEEERLILEATELICELMKEQDVSRATLAEALGTSRANVTQLLNGNRNMTLRTLADLLHVLDHRALLKVEPLRDWEFIGSPVRLEARSSGPRTIATVEGAETTVIAFPVDTPERLAG